LADLHETHIIKTRKTVSYTISTIAPFMMLKAGILRVIGAEQMQLKMAKVPHFENKLSIIGLLKIIMTMLYRNSRTMNVGFYLLASYGGGFIVAEIVDGEMPILGIMVTTFFTLALLRKPPSSGLLI